MTISTYTELQTAIENWSNRSDLDSVIPDFIAISEAEFNRRLKTSYQEDRTTVTVTAHAVSLPTDFASIRSLTDRYGELDYLTPGQFEPFERDNDVVRFYTLVEEGIRTMSDAGELTLVYYKKVPALASNSTNWLLTNHPDLYLYRGLQELADYIGDDQKLAKYKAKAEAAYREIQSADNARKYGAQLQVRVR
jgi:hypothetical protein